MKTSASLLLAVVAASVLAKEPNSGVLGSSSAKDPSGEAAEARLRAEFHASTEYSVLPSRGELVKEIELEGKWQSPGGFDSTSITFTRKRNGGYSVEFSTAGCVGAWELSREATYEGSVVKLNLPVQEYAPAEYTRLYTIAYRGEIHLLATARVKMFDEEGDKSFYKHLLLTKVRPKNGTDT